jgi:hypothetical protein
LPKPPAIEVDCLVSGPLGRIVGIAHQRGGWDQRPRSASERECDGRECGWLAKQTIERNERRKTRARGLCWLDIDRERAERYVKKLAKHQEDAKNRLEGLRKRLENKNYVDNAPKELVAETKQQVADAEQLVENMSREIARFSSATV